jgi:UDP:flavonoid glycosyltransferase YjiC (YdhE family)
VTRIVWLAAADARGHLMRGHRMRRLMGEVGVAVDLITTSEEGRAFLAGLGDPAAVLGGDYRIEYDERQDLRRGATERRILSYLARPRGMRRDLKALSALARGADLIVNDFHPLLLVGPSVARLPAPVVHVHGRNLWQAIEGHFAARGPRLLDRAWSGLLRGLRGRGLAVVEHAWDGAPAHDVLHLPPLVDPPARGAAEVRAALDLPPDARLAAVYLNPHFRDPALAAALEEALAGAGYRMHAVGEGFAARDGWRACDPGFPDVCAHADLLVSAPGMGALSLARLHGTPLLALVTDQPEQVANLDFMRGRPCESVRVDSPRLASGLAHAVARLARLAPAAESDPVAAARAVQARWRNTFLSLVERARCAEEHRAA